MNKMKKTDKTLKNKMNTIICNHCNEKIKSPELLGLTLICPHCKKSVNGQYHDLFGLNLTCPHCKQSVN